MSSAGIGTNTGVSDLPDIRGVNRSGNVFASGRSRVTEAARIRPHAWCRTATAWIFHVGRTLRRCAR